MPNNFWPYEVHLDRAVCVQGSYDEMADETTWLLDFTDNTLNRIVLGPDFFPFDGAILTPKSNLNGTVKHNGDFANACVVIGRTFEMEIDLGQLFRRTDQLVSDMQGLTTIRKIIVNHYLTGEYNLGATNHAKQTRQQQFRPVPDLFDSDGVLVAAPPMAITLFDPAANEDKLVGGFIEENGEFSAWFGGGSRTTDIKITSSTPLPTCIASAQVLVEHEGRRN